MKFQNIKVGDTVYLRPLEMGNAYRKDKSIKEAVIEKVGRKYITITRYGQFHIENRRQKTDFSTDYEFFISKQEIDDLMESKNLAERIRNTIPKYGDWKLDINKLREIAKILEC